MPKRVKKLSDRELGYWLCKHTPRNHCWIVHKKLPDMLSHEDMEYCDIEHKTVQLPPAAMVLSMDTFEYVYSVYMTQERLIAIIKDRHYYYLLDNVNGKREAEAEAEAELPEGDLPDDFTATGEGELDGDVEEKAGTDEMIDKENFCPVSSRLYFSRSLSTLLAKLSKNVRNLLDIKKRFKLNAVERTALAGVTSIDFFGKSIEEQRGLWNSYILSKDASKDRTLDLSGFFGLTDEVLMSTPINNIDTVVMNQNLLVRTLDWTPRFPRLQKLSMWFLPDIVSDMFNDIDTKIPGLLHVYVHHCYNLDSRILIPLSRCALLTRLFIDDQTFEMQRNLYVGLVMPEEWKDISNSTLEQLHISSGNLTIDRIQEVLEHFTGLKEFYINDLVFKKYAKEIDGSEPHTDQEPVKLCTISGAVLKLYRPLRFFGHVSKKFRRKPYSRSMLEIMQRNHPGDKDIQEMLDDCSDEEN